MTAVDKAVKEKKAGRLDVVEGRRQRDTKMAVYSEYLRVEEKLRRIRAQEIKMIKQKRHRDIRKRFLEYRSDVNVMLFLSLEAFRKAADVASPLTDRAWKMLVKKLDKEYDEAIKRRR